MSQNMDARRKAAKIWSRMLLEDTKLDETPGSNIAETLKDLAEESLKRLGVRKSGSNLHHAWAWCDYFIAAFEKILRELPPTDCSVEQLQEKITELRRIPAPVQHEAAPPEAQTVANKKRPATDQDGDDNANANAPNMSKRAKKDSEAAGNNFTVYTKGRYTVRVTEGDTPNAEFIFNVPATVQVKMVPGSGAAADIEAEGSNDWTTGQES